MRLKSALAKFSLPALARQSIVCFDRPRYSLRQSHRMCGESRLFLLMDLSTPKMGE